MKPSIVAARFAELLGRQVAIRVTWSPDELTAELVEVLPIGKDYFLRILVGGRRKLVNTRAVLMLGEAV